jgi:hypothetical protein
VDGWDGSWSHSSRRDHSGFNGSCTAMWKANGKTTTLQLFPDSLSPKNMRDSSSGDKLKFGDLSLEEAMDLSRDRQILELEHGGHCYTSLLDNCIQDFRCHVSKLGPILCNVSSVRTRRLRICFFFNKTPVLLYLFTIRCIDAFEELKHRETLF